MATSPPPGIVREDQGEEFDGLIASGGYGEVYKIRKGRTWLSTGKVFARKVIRLAYDGGNQQEIANEAEAVALLCTKGHPNIVQVLDHGHISMVNYYIDMELCDLSLAKLLKRKSKGEGLQDWYLQWPIENLDDRIFFLVALMQELANGLYFIHKHDRVHRDIKPENILYSARTGWWKLADFGLVKPGTTTVLRVTEHSRGTACYAAPELLLEGQFNKKTDIWALGCVFYEAATGEKVFTSDWAVITYAQDPQSRSLEPFTPYAHPKAAKLNELIALMLALMTDQRCNIASACNQIKKLISPISRTSTGPYYLSEDPELFWSPDTLVGTEGPIWTSISPRIDQIIPPSVLYDDLEALIARRKQLISSRAIYFLNSDHPVRIWTQLYLGYTFFHHPSPARSGLALAYLGTPLLSVSTLLDRQLHDQMYASLMSAFGWFTQVLNPLESRTLLLQLVTAQSRIKLRNGEANLKAAETKDLIAGAEASRFMDPNPTWVAKVDYIQLRAYRQFVDKFSPDVPLPAGSLVKPVIKSYFETPFHHSAFDEERSSFLTSVRMHISDALAKSRALFGPACESRLTTQLEIHQKLLELLAPVGPESFVHLPRLLDLFGPENQDVKSIVEQIKRRVEEVIMSKGWDAGHPTVLRTRETLSALKL